MGYEINFYSGRYERANRNQHINNEREQFAHQLYRRRRQMEIKKNDM